MYSVIIHLVEQQIKENIELSSTSFCYWVYPHRCFFFLAPEIDINFFGKFRHLKSGALSVHGNPINHPRRKQRGIYGY